MAITKTNARLLLVNDADNAVLTQTLGNEIATLPLSNLQLYSNARVFRTTDINEVQFTFVFDELRLLSGVALWRHNLSLAATWRVELFSDSTQINRVADSEHVRAVQQKTLGELEFLIDPLVCASLNTKYQSSEFWCDETLVRSMRITLKDPNNTDGFIDVTRIYAGRALQPEINFSYGHALGFVSQTTKYRTAGGSVHVKKRARPRTATFSMNYLQEAKRAALFNAVNMVGDDTDFYMSLFPETGTQKQLHYAFACMFQTIPKFDGISYNNFQTPFTVEEA